MRSSNAQKFDFDYAPNANIWDMYSKRVRDGNEKYKEDV